MKFLNSGIGNVVLDRKNIDCESNCALRTIGKFLKCKTESLINNKDSKVDTNIWE